jgi:hypothetical protein
MVCSGKEAIKKKEAVMALAQVKGIEAEAAPG